MAFWNALSKISPLSAVAGSVAKKIDPNQAMFGNQMNRPQMGGGGQSAMGRIAQNQSNIFNKQRQMGMNNQMNQGGIGPSMGGSGGMNQLPQANTPFSWPGGMPPSRQLAVQPQNQATDQGPYRQGSIGSMFDILNQPRGWNKTQMPWNEAPMYNAGRTNTNIPIENVQPMNPVPSPQQNNSDMNDQGLGPTTVPQPNNPQFDQQMQQMQRNPVFGGMMRQPQVQDRMRSMFQNMRPQQQMQQQQPIMDSSMQNFGLSNPDMNP